MSRIPEECESAVDSNKGLFDYPGKNFFPSFLDPTSVDKELIAADTQNQNNMQIEEIRTNSEVTIVHDQNESRISQLLRNIKNDLMSTIGKTEEIFTIEELKRSNERASSETAKTEEINVNFTSLQSEYRAGLLKVNCRIEDSIDCPILLDTGAKVNCIDYELLKSLKNYKIRKSGANLVAANKSRLKVIGNVALNIRFEGIVNSIQESCERTYHQLDLKKGKNPNQRQKTKGGKNGNIIELLVVEDLSTPILLGFPTIQSLGTVIDTRAGTIRIGSGHSEVILPFLRTEKEEYVYTIEKRILQPNRNDQRITVKFNLSESMDLVLLDKRERVGP